MLGQTCVAPDYLLVEQSVHQQLLEKIKAKLIAAYGEQLFDSPDLARIVNDNHFQRLRHLLSTAEVLHGGQHDQQQRFIAPTLVGGVDLDGELMEAEIYWSSYCRSFL